MPPLRPARVLPTLLLALPPLACGDDAGGPTAKLYQMSAVLVSSETLVDGTIRSRYEATVRDGNLLIAGAWILWSASTGDVSPSADRTNLNGTSQVEWTLEPGHRAGLESATLFGCAQDLAPPDCTPQPLLTVTFE